jgi:hypothetical protein
MTYEHEHAYNKNLIVYQKHNQTWLVFGLVHKRNQAEPSWLNVNVIDKKQQKTCNAQQKPTTHSVNRALVSLSQVSQIVDFVSMNLVKKRKKK